ncbi:hypothetical protein CJF30_00010871 [Rutstroemia sp. NJR-2017a BBW]|nr:hypothetical protein CJF30_00010871 [Rutstroemia sp. NJR-2017a BBW]
MIVCLGLKQCLGLKHLFIQSVGSFVDLGKKQKDGYSSHGYIGGGVQVTRLPPSQKKSSLKQSAWLPGYQFTVYKEQVLEPIILPLFEKVRTEYIFIEDRAKVHSRYVRVAGFEQGIRTLNWPRSSPGLN